MAFSFKKHKKLEIMKITIKNNMNCKCYSEHTSDDYDEDNELYDNDYDEDEDEDCEEEYDEEYDDEEYDDEDSEYTNDENEYEEEEEADEDYEYLDGNCGEEMPNDRSIYDTTGLHTEFIKKWSI